jgi:hypothetical protein
MATYYSAFVNNFNVGFAFGFCMKLFGFKIMTHFDDCICFGLLFVFIVYMSCGCPLGVVADV